MNDISEISIVIEGDNCTGKTTLGNCLEKQGFHVISNEPCIKKYEQESKQFAIGSVERFSSFINYNKLCGSQIRKFRKSVIVRYWISTLCAAYADGCYSETCVMGMVDNMIVNFGKPTIIVILTCNYKERVNRIINRVGFDDDISKNRDEKYSGILMQIVEMLKNKGFDCLYMPTETSTAEQLANKIIIRCQNLIKKTAQELN